MVIKILNTQNITKKIVLIGDAGVGKTSLVRRFVTGLFNPAYIVTLGTTILKKEMSYLEQPVILSIWDIGGQSVFKAVRSKYYFAAEGALAIVDRTKKSSFENLGTWIQSFREVVGDKPVVIAGNKSDLDNLVISDENLEELVSTMGHAEFVLTSAKNGLNVEKAFLNLTRLMLKAENEAG